MTIPKTHKRVLDASLLNTQHYKVRIKSKVEQSRERSSILPYSLLSLLLKRNLQVPLDYSRQLYFIPSRWRIFTAPVYIMKQCWMANHDCWNKLKTNIIQSSLGSFFKFYFILFRSALSCRFVNEISSLLLLIRFLISLVFTDLNSSIKCLTRVYYFILNSFCLKKIIVVFWRIT